MRRTDFQINNPVSTAGDYTMKSEDDYIGVTSTAAQRTITLAPAAAVGKGKIVVIKDESGGAGTNNIIADGNASETIDGSSTKTIAANSGSLMLYCTGTAWFSI